LRAVTLPPPGALKILIDSPPNFDLEIIMAGEFQPFINPCGWDRRIDISQLNFLMGGHSHLLEFSVSVSSMAHCL
jgi:hypothetical protein